jgi:hypothetical protein
MLSITTKSLQEDYKAHTTQDKEKEAKKKKNKRE